MRFFKILLLFATCFSNFAFSHNVNEKKFFVPVENHLNIYLKEKTLGKNRPIIILLNPLSIPSLSAFDVPGYSLMDALAQKGFDVWGIDFVGQGKASYPSEMQQNPAPKGVFPLMANDAVSQLEKATRFISNKTGQKSYVILGWSWGSAVAAMYSIQHPQQVDKLVLLGAMYSTPLEGLSKKLFVSPYQSEKENQGFNQALPAYQNIPWKMIKHHWAMMLNDNNTIVDSKAFQSVEKMYDEIDPKPFIAHTIRRPLGPMKDLFSIWTNHPVYDIKNLTSPTLVIYGDQDIFADHDLFEKLVNVKNKKLIVLNEATHWLIYEKNREQFIEEMTNFIKQK